MGGGGGGAAGTAWAVDLWQNAGGSHAVDGYRLRQEEAGGEYTVLYRFDNGNAVGLVAGGPAGGDLHILMLRLYPNGDLECWGGVPGSMFLIMTANDTTYTGNFNLAIGCRDNSASSLVFFHQFGGGGAGERHTRIIRLVKN